MQGRIHSYQSMGTLDGPGVRFVVFLQGCNLRCAYCHNPDTWNTDAGTLVEASEVLQRIKRYIPYFGVDGGVTLSGGEPLLQAEFTAELLQGCKDMGLHTAIDTSGCVLTQAAIEAMQLADLVLLDVKFTTDADYLKYTQCSLNTVLRFMEKLEMQRKPAWIRQVIIPGINDSERDMDRLHTLLKGYAFVQKVQLLPFHKLCLEKYDAMSLTFPLTNYPAADPERVQRLQHYLTGLFEKML